MPIANGGKNGLRHHPDGGDLHIAVVGGGLVSEIYFNYSFINKMHKKY